MYPTTTLGEHKYFELNTEIFNKRQILLGSALVGSDY